jgi:hypothetical protein
MALLDTGMVKPEEVFPPYMLVKNGITLFEDLKEGIAQIHL